MSQLIKKAAELYQQLFALKLAMSLADSDQAAKAMFFEAIEIDDQLHDISRRIAEMN